MGRFYHGLSEAFSGTNWVAELWQGSTPDSPDTSVELIITGIEFEYQGEGDRFYENPVRASRCTVGFTATVASNRQPSASVQTNLQNIATDEEQKWTLVIYKGGALHWVGRVLADQIRYKRTSEHSFICEVAAVDALNLIAGYDVDPAWFTSGKITGIDLLIEILAKANLSVHWNNAGAEDNYINDAIEHTNAAVTLSEKLAGIRLRDVAFIDGLDPFAIDIKYKNCKEALEGLLLAFGARIVHANGVYWIYQPNSYDDTNLSFDIYDNTGALFASDQIIAHRITVNASSRPAWEAKPVISYQQPPREFVVNYRAVNGVYGQKSTYNTSDLSGSGNIPANYPLKAQFTFDSETQPASLNFDRLVFRYRVYVRNPTSGVYYRYDSDSGTWQSIGTSAPGTLYYEFQIQDKRINGVGERLHVITYEMPAPPAGATEVYADAQVEWQRMGSVSRWSILGGRTVRSWASATKVAASWKGTFVVSAAYNTTEPYKWEKAATQSSAASSPRNLNSEKVEVTIPFYNGRVNDIGNIEVKSGTSWVNPGAWSVGWTANTGDIGQVLARQMMGLYRDFLPVIRGTLRDAGNYYAARSLYFDSGVWMMNGSRYVVPAETWEGEWVRIQQVFTGVNDNGEGERVATDNEYFNDKIKALEQAWTKQTENWTFLKDKFTDAVFEDVAPDQPAGDQRWNIQLKYNSSDGAIDFDAAPDYAKPWGGVVKTTDESTASDTTLSDDAELSFPMAADTVYAIRAVIPFYATSATGFKLATAGPSCSNIVERADLTHPGGQHDNYMNTAFGTPYQPTLAATGAHEVKLDIVCTTTAAGTFKLQWAQASGDAANVTVYAGAYIDFKIVRPATDEFLLLETGDYLLLETGDYIILE